MKKVEHICDIQRCNKEANKNAIEKKIQVIFHTEQTEGKPSGAYLSMETLDLCTNHYGKVLNGTYIHASGAQGNNRYYFKD